MDMMLNKDQWIIEHEQIGVDYADGAITRDEAMMRMKCLGFREQEAADELDMIDDEPR